MNPRRYPRTLTEAFGPYTSSHIETAPEKSTMRTYFTAILAILAFLALCFWANRANAEPIHPTRDNPEVQLKVVFDTPANTRATCLRLGAWESPPPARLEVGCAAFSPALKTCTVYTPMPQELNDNRTLILGHETLHCLTGRYHD